ncbi:MAG: hypothetical protein NTY48_05565 [Candidatus Diapherotrites archaeon]|nr:hypothetical protein [Candidatus Diapherotrites archaeon]
MNPEEIKKLYWKDNLSTRKIAHLQHTHQRAIIDFMKAHNIPRRNRIEAVIKGCKKYDKKEFSGNECEKAYLLGLTLADFRRRRHGYQINITAGSTHPAFILLFRKIFEKYSPIKEYVRYNKEMNKCERQIDVTLHSSFDFLLGPKDIPEWVMKDNSVFLHFLAGYADGEGTLSIGKSDNKYVSFIFAIASEDVEILKKITEKLKFMGFTPLFKKIRTVGEFNILWGKKLTYTKDHFLVRLKKKVEVISLLPILPIRHPEKILKRKLMLKLSGSSLISDTYAEWAELRNSIKNEVESYHAKNRADYLRRSSFKISSARE